MDTNINRHAQLASEKEATPGTPHFDNPQLSELPGKTRSAECFPPLEPPIHTPGLLYYSLGLLTGAALVLILKRLTEDDTTPTTEKDESTPSTRGEASNGQRMRI